MIASTADNTPRRKYLTPPRCDSVRLFADVVKYCIVAKFPNVWKNNARQLIPCAGDLFRLVLILSGFGVSLKAGKRRVWVVFLCLLFHSGRKCVHVCSACYFVADVSGGDPVPAWQYRTAIHNSGVNVLKNAPLHGVGFRLVRVLFPSS